MKRVMRCQLRNPEDTMQVRFPSLMAGRVCCILVVLAAVTLGGAAALSPAAAPTSQNGVSVAQRALLVACPGDCNSDREVKISEVVRGVNIALGLTNAQTCPGMDSGGNGSVEVNEIVRAVNALLIGCAPVAAGILKNEGYSSTQTAEILEGFGYESTDCGGALMHEFGGDPWGVGADLKDAGYSCNEIDHALQNLFAGVDSRQVLNDIGCQVELVDPETPGYDQLGSGYDVFTAYADAEFVKNKILDVDALNHDAKLVQFPVDKFSVNQFQGTTIDEYVTSLSVSAGLSGSYAFFSGSINTTMSQMASVTTEWSFATVQVKHRVHGLTVLKMQPVDLTRYLLHEFSNDINSDLDPAVLFDLYGTHVIGKLVVGGRLDYDLSALISNQQEKRNIGVSPAVEEVTMRRFLSFPKSVTPHGA